MGTFVRIFELMIKTHKVCELAYNGTLKCCLCVIFETQIHKQYVYKRLQMDG